MKGVYVLVIELDKDATIEVGALGRIDFSSGYYTYVGSAQKGVESRVERHIREEKKKHWHIDYILENAEIIQVFTHRGEKEEECKMADFIDGFSEAIEDFGCSDCNCISHLFYHGHDLEDLLSEIERYPNISEFEV